MSVTRVPTKQVRGIGTSIGWMGWPPMRAVERGLSPGMGTVLPALAPPAPTWLKWWRREAVPRSKSALHSGSGSRSPAGALPLSRSVSAGGGEAAYSRPLDAQKFVLEVDA